MSTAILVVLRRLRLPALIVALGTAAPAFHPAAAERRPITETDLFSFVWVADPRISPDGKQAVFVRVSVNKKKDRYDTALWIVPTDASQPARPFTAGPQDAAPRWSPDGRWIAFTRAVEKDGKPQPPQLYLIAANGGEARALTTLPKGAGAPAWSPDGRRIAFTSTTTAEDLQKQEREKKEGRKPDERESDVRVITRAVYRFNDAGYLDPKRRSHIWVLDLAQPSPTSQSASDRSARRNISSSLWRLALSSPSESTTSTCFWRSAMSS